MIEKLFQLTLSALRIRNVLPVDVYDSRLRLRVDRRDLSLELLAEQPQVGERPRLREEDVLRLGHLADRRGVHRILNHVLQLPGGAVPVDHVAAGGQVPERELEIWTAYID